MAAYIVYYVKMCFSGLGYRTPHFGPERVTRIAMAAYIVYYVEMLSSVLGYRTPRAKKYVYICMKAE